MPEQLPRKVTGSYKRSVSDGNYGTEGAEVTFEWWMDEDEADESMAVVATELMREARKAVLLHLRGSLNANVRRQATPITPAKAAPTAPAGDEEDLPF